MGEIRVRDVLESDAGALARLLHEFNGMKTTAEQVRGRLSRGRGVEYPVIAEVDGEAVGFASLRLVHYLGEDVPFAEISDLFVREPSRRRGVAAALLAELEARARAAGSSGWNVVTGGDNDAAQGLYRRAGFETHAVAMQRWFSDSRPFRS